MKAGKSTATPRPPRRALAPRRQLRSAAKVAAAVADASDDTGLAAAMLKARRQDIETLLRAGKLTVEGLQTVIRRRRHILRESLSELKAVVKVMRVVGARESVAHLDGLGRGAANLTLASIRELASLAAATQNEALKLLEQRLREDIADLRRLRRAKPARDAGNSTE